MTERDLLCSLLVFIFFIHVFLDVASSSSPNVPTISDQPAASNENVEEDVDINNVKYTLSEMSKDLQSRATIFGPDSARARDELKRNQPKDFSYPKRNFSKMKKGRKKLWYETWKWLHYNEIDDTKFFYMLSDVKVEEAFVKKGYYKWKYARSTDKGFNTHESSRCHQQAVYRLLAVPKSTQDISLALEKNPSNVQRQNRESLLKVISSVRYLARQGLPLRGKKDDKDSNFQQLLKLRAENDPVFTE